MQQLISPFLFSFFELFAFIVCAGILLFFRFIYPKKRISPVVLFLVVCLFPLISLFRPGIFESSDMGTHIGHLTTFYRNLQEGVLVPRWAGDICGTYGCPVFIIEYLLPYYIGSIFHFFGFSILMSIKLVLATSFITSGVTMYLFAKEELSKRAAFVAAILYLFVPYHFIDLYFRASIGEVLSFVFIPLIFLFVKKLIEKASLINFFLYAVAVVSLLLSHPSIAISSVPFSLAYGYVAWKRKKKQRYVLFLPLLSLAYALLLSSFYWIPAEKEVQFMWQGFFTSYGGFPNPLYYIISSAGFGLLYQGHNAQIYPIIGYVQIVLIITALWMIIQKRIGKNMRFLLMFFILSFFILFLLLLPITKFIWDLFPLLHSFVLIERLLVPIGFMTAMIGGIVASTWKRIFPVAAVCFFAIVITIFNWSNRKMVPLPPTPISAENEFYTEYIEKDNPLLMHNMQQRLPQRLFIATHPPEKHIEFLSGKGAIQEVSRQQQRHEYHIIVNSDAVIRENTNYFPGWAVYANGKHIPITYTNTTSGSFDRITFSLPKGIYTVVMSFEDTLIRRISAIISFIALLGGIGSLVVAMIKKNIKI